MILSTQREIGNSGFLLLLRQMGVEAEQSRNMELNLLGLVRSNSLMLLVTAESTGLAVCTLSSGQSLANAINNAIKVIISLLS